MLGLGSAVNAKNTDDEAIFLFGDEYSDDENFSKLFFIILPKSKTPQKTFGLSSDFGRANARVREPLRYE